jgi:hypothetical protein
MAKKETTKKTTKKTAKKLEEQAPIEVQEFEEAAALEIVEETKVEPEDIGPAEVRQEILDKIKFDDAVLENLEKEDEKAIEGFETMNGDPAVVTPVEETEPLVEEQEKIEEESVEEETPAPQEKIKPKNSVFRRMFGYIWNGQEMDY